MSKKKISIPIEVLSLQEDGYHLFISARLNGHELRLLIDTGASRTVLDKNFLTEHFPDLKMELNEQLTTGVGTNTIQSEFTEVADLRIGDLKFPTYKFAVLDLKHVNETYSMIDVAHIHGVIGSDILVDRKAVINLKKKQLRFRK